MKPFAIAPYAIFVSLIALPAFAQHDKAKIKNELQQEYAERVVAVHKGQKTPNEVVVGPFVYENVGGQKLKEKSAQRALKNFGGVLGNRMVAYVLPQFKDLIFEHRHGELKGYPLNVIIKVTAKLSAKNSNRVANLLIEDVWVQDADNGYRWRLGRRRLLRSNSS